MNNQLPAGRRVADRAAGLLGAFLACVFLAGCATSRDSDLSRLAQNARFPAPGDLIQAPGTNRLPVIDSSEAPDSPISGLPDASMELPEAPMGGVSDDVMSGVRGIAITIQPDSVVNVRVAEDSALGGNLKVNDIGAIQLGYIGPVILYNMTEPEAERKIRRILESRMFKTATVTVKILQASYDKIAIAGTVVKPGIVRIGSGDTVTLNNALLNAGGITGAANQTRVRVVRGGLTSSIAASLPGEEYKLVDESGAPHVPEVFLRNNDIAYVFNYTARGPGRRLGAGSRIVLVLGEVAQEGYYTFSSSETLSIMNLILKMNGLPPYANDKAIRVIRRDSQGLDHEQRVNAREIFKEGNPDLDFPLQHGDRVIVPARRISLF